MIYEQGLTALANNSLRIEYVLSRTLTLRAEAGIGQRSRDLLHALVRLSSRGPAHPAGLSQSRTRNGGARHIVCRGPACARASTLGYLAREIAGEVPLSLQRVAQARRSPAQEEIKPGTGSGGAPDRVKPTLAETTSIN